MDNPFKQRQEQRNKILSKKDEEIKKKEIAELEKTFELEDTKERFEFAARTLKEYGGLESNIPVYHPYWKLRP
ncbi:hypothetical protein HYZ97_02760 [Candidatus Pacearchaeota archaeon]|nr:hypothetical protein [Candidatus Pacearchaeota archaeon]